MVQEEKVRYFTREVLDVKIRVTGEEKPIHAGMVIVLKNITRFLEQDEAKTNFMATISHELKTPISSLRLNLRLLDDPRIGALNDEQKEIVRALKLETGNMLTITSELLDLAQVETGNIVLNLRMVKPIELLEYVKESSASHARKKDIQLNYEAPPELPPVYADPEKTVWVLMNLINNAIQYSNTGSMIRVRAERNYDEIIFMVEDFGTGIENRHLELIFEKFYRVPGSAPHGTGLGLSISKEFIIKQKGKIWAESEPGAGSRFFFSLPVYADIEQHN
jgi:two-component system, NtrC family, sensor histidine kinase KinB